MSFKSHHNMHCSSLGVKRESFDSSVAIKLEVLDSPKKSMSSMHHLSNSGSGLMKCKKQVNFSKMSYPSPHTPPTSVVRRNERERNRVKMVNMGFATLRQHVPNGAKNKKMSKVETLRSAVEYIRQLQRVLGQNSENSFSLEQYDSLLQAASTSGDENCYPSPMPSEHNMESSPMEENSNLEQAPYSNQVSYTSLVGAMYNPATSDLCNKLTAYSLPSPHSTMMHTRTSPSPSAGSDITSSSSPYDNHSLLESSHRQTSTSTEEELFDFSNWF